MRAGDNPKLHNARWSGLILWWQDTFGKLQVNLAKPVDLANTDRAMGPATPLPPDRPSGASPEKLEDAAQEFLTDWLVRRQYDQALEFLSPQAYALPEPERRCEEPGAGRVRCAPRGSQADGIRRARVLALART